MPPLTVSEPTDSMNHAQRGLETRGAVYDGREFEARIPHNPEPITNVPEQIYSHSPELEKAHVEQVVQDAHEYAIPGQEHYAPAPQPTPEEQPVHTLEYASDSDALADVQINGDAMVTMRSRFGLAA